MSKELLTLALEAVEIGFKAEQYMTDADYALQDKAVAALREALAEQPAQRTWVDLTDEEIDMLEELYAPPVHPDFVSDADHCFSLIKKVEAKLKEKNT